MIHHLRQYHPDQYEEPWRWPDGGLVIEDDYPDMEDFLTPQRIQVLAQDVAWTCPGCLQTESYTVLWYTLQPVSLRCPHCKTESAPIQPPEL
jgi:hypothetical protein